MRSSSIALNRLPKDYLSEDYVENSLQRGKTSAMKRSTSIRSGLRWCLTSSLRTEMVRYRLTNLSRTMGGELSMEDAEAAVELSDLNGDGVLDFDEFQILMESSSANEEEKNNELRDSFKMYVMEDSSYITHTSLRRMFKRLGESRSVDDCKAMIRAFGLNGEVLSLEEFAMMMH